MRLEPFPFIVRIFLYPTWLVVKGPCIVEIGVPWPEPVPEVDILCGPSNPAEVMGDGMLCVCMSDDISYVIPERWTIVIS